MLNTSALRREYSPACSGKGGMFLEAWKAFDAVMKAHSYAPRSQDSGSFNCRRVTGGSGYSLHAYGPGDVITFWNGLRRNTALSFDFNWQSNLYSHRLVTDMPPAMRSDLKKIRTKRGDQVFGWGGDYRSIKDAMHWEIVCSRSSLASGINWSTVVGGGKKPVVAGPPRTIKLGMRGGDVQLAQGCLNLILWAFHDRRDWKGHNGQGLETDGVWGPKSRRLCQTWEVWYRTRQYRAGKRTGLLTPDGYITPPSWRGIEFDVNQAKKKLGIT